jgi:SAM-dependent methyltransferase
LSVFAVLKWLWTRLPEPVRDAAERTPVGHLKNRVRRLVGRSEMYGYGYFEELEPTTRSSAPVIAATVGEELAPTSALDVGCGTGAVLAALQSRGVRVVGIDYADAALEFARERGLEVRKVDLEAETLPPLERTFDVVISTEVAEHLDARHAERYVRLLCDSAEAAVVFTAATPGQGGYDHVNEQPHGYWISKFQRRGFVYDASTSRRWRDLWRDGGACDWYWRNVMVFLRTGTRSKPRSGGQPGSIRSNAAKPSHALARRGEGHGSAHVRGPARRRTSCWQLLVRRQRRRSPHGPSTARNSCPPPFL